MDRSFSFVTVLGGVNVDIIGTPFKRLRRQDSNPGRLQVSFGGVGRNIAENMSRLGTKVEMITIFGDDFYGEEIRKDLSSLGIGYTLSLELPGVYTSTYLCINDAGGDMAVAISDMDIYKQLTPAYLKTKMSLINEGKFLVIDTNITKEVIEYVASETKVPIIAEPVSTTKAEKLKGILDKLFLVKPNMFELEVLSGKQIQNEQDLDEAVDILLEKGVKHVVVSLGKDGVLYANASEKKRFEAKSGKIVNTTGCGDALLGGIVSALEEDKPMENAILVGIECAKRCMESATVVSKEITEEILEMN